MIYFTTCGLYIQSITDLKAKIAAIDDIIDKLYVAASDAALGDGVKEYSLNDGQVIIKEIYSGTKAISEAIDLFEKQKQRYINRINGRKFRLVHEKNFGRRYF